MGKYIVTINRPYYPSVDYFDTLPEALAKYRELLGDHEPDGGHKAQVSISTVMETEQIKTHW